MKKFTSLLLLLLTMLVGGVNCAYAQDGLLDRKKWSVTVSSECADKDDGSQGWVRYLTDGDMSTYWHSNWRETTADKAKGDPEKQLPQFIMVDLGEVQDVHTIIYAPRVPGANVNGGALDYEIYTSNEAFDYTPSSEEGSAKKWYDAYANSHTPVAKGAFSYENDGYKTEIWKYASLPTVQKTRYVMFVITNSNGDDPGKFANCVEFNIAPSAEAALAFAKNKAQVYYDSEAVAENINERAVHCYKQEVIDSWKKELDAAATAEQADAVAFKYYRKQWNPLVPGKLYRIVSGDERFMAQQNVRKVMLSTGSNSFGWNTEKHSDVAQYWWFSTEGDGYKIQNVMTGTYIAGAGATNTTGKKVDLAFVKPGCKAHLRVADLDAKPLHANAHGNGAGVNGGIIFYGDYGSAGCDVASTWIIEEVTLDEAKKIVFPNNYNATESVNFGGKTIVPVGTYDKAICQERQANYEKLMPQQTSLEGVNQLLHETFPIKPVVQFEAGKYYRIVCPEPKTNVDHNALSINSSNKVCTEVYGNASINQLWQVLTDDGGLTYYIQQANSGKYVGDVRNSDGKRVDAVAEKNLFELIQNTDVNTSQYRIQQVNGRSEQDNLFAENGTGDGFACAQWRNEDNNRAASWYFLPVDDVEVALTQVGEHTYATAHLPFAVSAVEGAKAYTGQLNTAKDRVALVEAPAFAANEGVVLMGESGQTTATLTIGGTAEKVTGNAFAGTNTEIAFSDAISRDNYLVFGRKSGETTSIGFFKPSEKVTKIPANRAFIANNSTNGTSSVLVNFGTVEGLGSIVTETSEDANSPIYDLSGRRVMHTVKGGLYIRNGKKFLVK